MFEDANFREAAPFAEASFAGKAWLGKAKFAGAAEFRFVQFGGPARFRGAHFAGKAHFDQVSFEHGVRFRNAQFDAEASFTDARFVGDAWFDKADAAHLVLTDTDLSNCQFRGAFHLDQLRHPPTLRYLPGALVTETHRGRGTSLARPRTKSRHPILTVPQNVCGAPGAATAIPHAHRILTT
ncbi:pentapeptide repeat-containing protein [Streptomyces sp. NPDC047880]|uniref:pentapeptide repeat-containing protein n=1 Tax=Streptomyces sp. NPDC047880 TaxID=3155626 RepID=UPI0034569154